MNVKDTTTTEQYNSVSKLPADVKQFCQECCGHYPFLSLDYYSAFEEHVLPAENQLPLYLVVRLNDKPVAMLPVTTDRKLRFKYCRSLTNYYFFRYDLFMADDTFENTAAREAAFFALKGWLNQFSQIDFKPVHEEDTKLLTFCRWMEQKSWRHNISQITSNWSADIFDMDVYRSSLSSRTLNTLKRTHRKLQQQGMHIQIYSTHSEITEHLSEYWDVYQSSWKPTETYPGFVEAALLNENETTGSLLCVLYLNNVPVASQIWFTQDATAYIYKLAYRPEYKNLSPGSNLTWHMIQYCSEELGIHTLNILNGDENYKRELFNRSQPVYEIQMHKNLYHSLARAFA